MPRLSFTATSVVQLTVLPPPPLTLISIFCFCCASFLWVRVSSAFHSVLDFYTCFHRLSPSLSFRTCRTSSSVLNWAVRKAGLTLIGLGRSSCASGSDGTHSRKSRPGFPFVLFFPFVFVHFLLLSLGFSFSLCTPKREERAQLGVLFDASLRLF